ncbi:unnamed protein product [Chilo suppressalis]|uniref:Protein-cysteine N-palmitoyltransferase Rasp n=1 Tax=Chilo suppressalis TaxID=168631 RepID=A0ABN8B732_CHISP|nr:hypothetical protein evm_008874 [Chilo suppressalis]CAH0405328.1 unnamed protein product [Chilo suppressalis]
MRSKLSSFELFLYFSFWIAANILCLFKLFEAQSNYYQNNYSELYSLGELKPGWRFISRFQDVSDIEWISWKFFIQTAWLFLLFQFFVSEVIRYTYMPLIKFWYIVSSISFIILFMGYRQLVIILAQPMLFATIIYFGGGKICVWTASILLLISYNSLKYKYFFWYYLDRDDLQDEEVYLVLFTIAWIKLRCVSFLMDYLNRKEQIGTDVVKANFSFSQLILNMFSYVLYTPLLYIGPIILYEDFERSFSSHNGKFRFKFQRFLWDMFLYATYTFLLDCSFHYVYFLAMQSDIEAIRKLPTIALCGGGLWMGLEFHLKYLISYGTTTAFARLDNLDPPPTPRCIVRVHVYSQMWRYFDVGLYKFLVKYIYIPALEVMTTHFKLKSIINKLCASFLTFVFIFMWHGTIWNIFVWSVLNYLGIALEQFGKVIYHSNYYQILKTGILKSDEMETRFIALLCTPLLALSAISNFYLFGGSSVVSLALQDVPSRTDRKRYYKECHKAN